MSETTSPHLVRALGPGLLMLYGMGTIVGAGIWVLVGEVAAVAGLLAPLAFLVAAAVAGLTGASYATLASVLPEAGGEVVYVDRAFARRTLTAVTGWAVAFTGVVSAATIARGFAGYLGVLVPLPELVVIAGITALLTAIAIRGILASAWFATLLTVVSVGALLWLVGARFEVLADWRRLPEAVNGEVGDVHVVLSAAFVAFYAFIGFEDMVNVAEEVRRPRVTIPLAIGGALLGSAVLYALVASVAVLAVPPAELARQPAPLAHVMGRGADDPWIALAGLMAVTNSALAQLVMASRILLGLARKGLAPALFARIGARGTPAAGTAVVGATVLALALTQEIGTLARLTSGVVLAVFATVNLALLVLRVREPTTFRTPLLLPVLALVASGGLLLAALVAS